MTSRIHCTLIVTALVACAAPAALAAQSPARAAGGKSPTACGLFTSAEIAKVLKRPELANARQIGGEDDEGPLIVPGSSSGCGYLGTSLQVSLMQVTSVKDFDAAAKRRVTAGELKPSSGLGDAVWLRHNKYLKQDGLMVRVGSSVLTLMIDASEAGSADKATAMLRPLAETAVQKLRASGQRT